MIRLWLRFWDWMDRVDASVTPEQADAIILSRQLTRHPG
jgi:hypothetical protein